MVDREGIKCYICTFIYFNNDIGYCVDTSFGFSPAFIFFKKRIFQLIFDDGGHSSILSKTSLNHCPVSVLDPNPLMIRGTETTEISKNKMFLCKDTHWRQIKVTYLLFSLIGCLQYLSKIFFPINSLLPQMNFSP